MSARRLAASPRSCRAAPARYFPATSPSRDCVESSRTRDAWRSRQFFRMSRTPGGRRFAPWRGRLRRLLPYVVAAGGGFLLAYLIVAFFVFPAGVIPQDVRVPNVIGLTYSDAVQQLQQKGFTAERGESRFHNAAPKGTVL